METMAISKRDANHLSAIRTLSAYYPPDAEKESHFWWGITEAERDFHAAMSAGTAAEFDDPHVLFTHWRRQESSAAYARYIEDWIGRVQTHLREGTGARRVSNG